MRQKIRRGCRIPEAWEENASGRGWDQVLSAAEETGKLRQRKNKSFGFGNMEAAGDLKIKWSRVEGAEQGIRIIAREGGSVCVHSAERTEYFSVVEIIC